MTIKNLTLIITLPYLLSFGFSCEIKKSKLLPINQTLTLRLLNKKRALTALRSIHMESVLWTGILFVVVMKQPTVILVLQKYQE